MRKRVCILIPVFNGIEYTKKCLTNLNELLPSKTHSSIDIKIVVIDDGSTDNTSTWIKNNMPEVVLLNGNGKLWWSGGINLGARYAIEQLRTDFVLLWNNDIIISDDYFLNLEKIILTDDSIDILGSKIFKNPENIIWSFGGKFNPRTGKKYMIGYNQPDNESFQQPAEVDWITGMGTLVSKHVIDKIGYWDDINFPQYHGDNDFTYRAKLLNLKLIVHPDLKIWNDTTNTGIVHKGNFKQMIRMMTDIKSHYNISKNFLFYRKYCTSVFAYLPLFKAYFKLIGGFLKWKALLLFGFKRN